MAQSGFTPILLYASGTPGNSPSAGNLTSSASGAELAVNYADGKLFYKDSGGNVQTLASKATGSIGGSDTQVQYNSSGSLAGSANLTFNGTTLTVADLADSSLTSGRVTYATTGGNLTDSANLTFNGTTLTANSAAVSTGNLSFTGTAQRITGDMSNATLASRVMFQSSTANNNTFLGLIPNGSAGVSEVFVYSASDPANSSFGGFTANTSAAQVAIESSKTGTGTYLPMTFYTGGSEAMRITTSRNVSIGSTADNGNLFVSGANSRVRFANTAGTASTLLFAQDSGAVGIGTETNSFLYLTTNNTERMRIDTSGNVGIGTSSPGYKLSVNGDAAVLGQNTLRLQNSDNTNAYALQNAGATGSGNAYLSFVQSGVAERMRIDSSGNVGIGTASPGERLNVNSAGAEYAIQWNSTGSNNWVLASATNRAYIVNKSTSAEVLTILNGGNVGIGTASPGYTLEINKASGNFRVRDASAGNDVAITTIAGPVSLIGSTGATAIAFGTNATERMRIDTSGNVGIGTASPSVRLQATNTSGEVFRLTNTTATERLHFYTRNAAGTSRVESQNSDLQLFAADPNLVTFGTNNTERARITSGGDFGIGVTPTNYGGTFTTLAVNNSGAGVLDLMSGGVSQFRLFGNASENRLQGVTNVPMTFYTNNTERARIDSGGKFLVATQSDYGGVINVSGYTNGGNYGIAMQPTANDSTPLRFRNAGSTEVGSVTCTATATAFNTTSDYRLKTFVAKVTGSGARLDALNPVEYEWKETGHRARGFFAHEFQQVYADSVTGEKDAVDEEGKPVYQAMQASTAEVIADLVAEIQSLRARVAALEAA